MAGLIAAVMLLAVVRLDVDNFEGHNLKSVSFISSYTLNYFSYLAIRFVAYKAKVLKFKALFW